MDTSKNYWFGILSYVFYTKKGNDILLYNTQNGESIKSNNSDIISLIEQMHERKNLGVILLKGSLIENKEIADFIKESTDKKICKFIQITEEKAIKPVQMMPVLNLQREVERLIKGDDRSIGENLIHYLLNVTIQITTKCQQNCKNCSAYYKQFNCCNRLSKDSILSLEDIEQVFTQIKNAPLQKLTITGGNIFEYPYLDELVILLNKYQFETIFNFHYLNFDIDKIDILSNYEREIIITFPIENEHFQKINSFLSYEKVKIVFAIKSANDYAQAEEIVEKYNIDNYNVQPFFDGNNINFFEENVFISEEDILANPIKQRIIFANQKMNTNFFGTFNILANGNVDANLNTPEIGNINKNTILEMLYTEMIENTAWRKTRNEKPCIDCIYQYLCPSPSNYELVIGKMNLCLYKS